MHVNSSSNSTSRIISIDQSLVGRASGSSSLSLHQLYGWVKMPAMVAKASKYQILPDQPDRAGMRERRKQGEMALAELQRSRGIEPTENPHTEILDAYGYRQLADLVFGMPEFAMRMLNAIGDVMTIQIGPPCADAAPVRGGKSVICENPSLANFVKKYSRDFEIWLSPAAKTAVDMRGMIFVIGEHHFNERIQVQVNSVMHWFRNIRTTKIFLEGGVEGDCEWRMSEFGLSTHECHSLEVDSPSFARIAGSMIEFHQKLERVINFMLRHVPSAMADKQELTHTEQLAEFMMKHQYNVPLGRAAEYNRLAIEVKEAEDALEALGEVHDPQREKWMSSLLRRERSLAAPNVAVVGAGHGNPLVAELSDLPCVYLIPKSIVKEHPETVFTMLPKDEL